MKSSSFNRPLLATAILAFFIFGTTNAFAREVVLKEATLVPIQTKERISSKDMRAGRQVILSVERDIKVDGATVIASGAPVFAVVSDRKGAGRAGISGHITINVESATAVDGTAVPLKGSFNTKGDSEIGGTVAVGTILCPLAFLNRGKEGIIPAGAVIRTLTLSDKTVTVSDK